MPAIHASSAAPFEGRVLSVDQMLAAAAGAADGGPPPSAAFHDVADEAEVCADLAADGEDPRELWRFGVMQTIDDYNRARRAGGVARGAAVFDREPPRTGAPGLDAAFAALAEHLADRDGWQAPSWAHDPSRTSPVPWIVAGPAFEAWARAETPQAFARRGVWITAGALARA
jgi:hypothetical protein